MKNNDINYYPKGTYVVLLRTCTGEPDLWTHENGGDPLHVNYIFRLTEDSNTFSFLTEKNGWTTINKEFNQLLLRQATQDEINKYISNSGTIDACHTLEEGFEMKKIEPYNNTVIAVNNTEHAKEVIKYWADKGIDTGTHLIKDLPYMGNDLNFYYGLIDYKFGFYTVDEVWDKCIFRDTNYNIQTTYATSNGLQYITRNALKEIYNVACNEWKKTLEAYANRNPFDDFICLSNNEVENMFNACDDKQLKIVSKFLIRDDGSIILKDIKTDKYGILLDNKFLLRVDDIETDNKSFWLNNDFNWEIKLVHGFQRLIPTKKK